ncbi:major capsid protein [Vibrio phage 1.182.O._10N.286.46.E1]|nr:major capsid protein [Vibrio phage 1.182.O._10N.286.46.E1]
MAYSVPEHHVLQFSDQVGLLSQQMESDFFGAVDVRDFFGENAEVIKQYGTTEFTDLTDPQGDTVFDSIDKNSRWCFPADKKNVLATTREDELRTIINTTNPLVMGQAAALARLYDAIIMAGAIGTNQTGKYDALVSTPLPAEQIINAAATGIAFSLAFVKEAKKKMDDANVPKMGRYIGVSTDQMSRLMDDPEVTSSDYNTVKALVQGEINTYLGFTWIMSTSVPVTGDIESAVCWHQSGVCLGLWSRDGRRVFSRIDERKDKNYLTQVYSKVTLGATRTEEVKVVEIRSDKTAA